MRAMRWVTALAASLVALASSQAAPTLPPGWTAAGNADGRERYAPTTPQPGEETAVVVSPRTALAGSTLTQWANQAIQQDSAPAGGRWSSEPAVKSETATVASGRRAWRDAAGNTGLAIYLAYTGGRPQARLARWTANSEATARRHESAASSLMRQLIALEKDAAPAPEPAAKAPTPPAPARYPWTTAPGQGVKASDIAAVTYAWRQVYTVTGVQIIEDVYLLLKDGTAHDGLPVPPQDLDVAASRLNEPTRWGRWKKQGDGYLFAWPAKPDQFRAEAVEVMRPGPAGATLDGRWQGASSYNLPGVATTWAQYGLRLGADGRFEQTRFGGASVGGGAGRTQTTTAYDENGATGTSAGPGFVVGTGARQADRGDHSGRYTFDGYALVLHYDDGTTVRKPWFQTDDKATAVWLDGSMLTRPSAAKK